MKEFLRFFLVALSGLAIDLCVSWVLAERAGWPLWLAAAAGFGIAAIANYFAHEYWTFRGRRTGFSPRRAAQYLAVLLVTLGVRLGTVIALERLVGGAVPTIVILLLATGCSFVANFLVSKRVIFAKAPPVENCP